MIFPSLFLLCVKAKKVTLSQLSYSLFFSFSSSCIKKISYYISLCVFWYIVILIQSLSWGWLFVTPWTAHTRLPCRSLYPRVCSNSCPLSWWCFITISSSVISFSICLQPFPASGSFPMNWLFALHGPKCWEFQLGNGKQLQDSLPWEPHGKYVVKCLLNSSYPELLSMSETWVNFIYSLFA